MATYPVKQAGWIGAGKTFEVRFRPAVPGVIKVISQVSILKLPWLGSRALRQKLEVFKPGNQLPVASETGESEAVWWEPYSRSFRRFPARRTTPKPQAAMPGSMPSVVTAGGYGPVRTARREVNAV